MEQRAQADPGRLLTARELTARTGLPRWRVYQLVREHGLPHVRLGRALRFQPAAVGAWLARGGTRPGAAHSTDGRRGTTPSCADDERARLDTAVSDDV